VRYRTDEERGAVQTVDVEVSRRSARQIVRAYLCNTPNNEKVNIMLYTIAIVLLVLWLLGLVTSYTLGGFIHILIVVAVVMILVNLISGRR